jgi:hypothetical protein
MVERDLAQDSSIGVREWVKGRETPTERLNRTLTRARRKFRAAASFFRAWGVREFLSFLPLWR